MLGPNGAGKTTTISILTTTLAPTGGVLRVAAHDVSSQARLRCHWNRRGRRGVWAAKLAVAFLTQPVSGRWWACP